MVVVSVAAISTTITMIIVCLEAHATADSMVMTTEIVGLLETTIINRPFDNSRSRIFGGSAATESRSNNTFNNRQSSTRSTLPAVPNRTFGADRGSMNQEPSRIFDRSNSERSFGGSAPTRSFGDNVPSRSFGNSAPSRSFGGESAPTRSFGGGGTTQGSHGVFGGRR